MNEEKKGNKFSIFWLISNLGSFQHWVVLFRVVHYDFHIKRGKWFIFLTLKKKIGTFFSSFNSYLCTFQFFMVVFDF